MSEIYETISAENSAEAEKIIEELQIRKAWQSIGAEVNLVGSLACGLLCKHLDIDFHVYSNIVNIEDSFKVVAKLATNKFVRKVSYLNFLDTEEACLQWQLIYETEQGKNWQIDIVHIKKNSKYDGFFERQAECIKDALDDKTRKLILQLKYETPENEHIMGIEYYQAVLEAKVQNYQEFAQWRKLHPVLGIVEWLPICN